MSQSSSNGRITLWNTVTISPSAVIQAVIIALIVFALESWTTGKQGSDQKLADLSAKVKVMPTQADLFRISGELTRYGDLPAEVKSHDLRIVRLEYDQEAEEKRISALEKQCRR